MAENRSSILLISSHVVRGSVGNRVMGFALERLGFDVWNVPTIILPHHPGQGPAQPIVPDDAAFGRLLDDVAAGGADRIGAILSGYLATPGQVDRVAALVGKVRTANPDCRYLCDPVIGDHGSLYVSPGIAEAIRDHLLPLADIATPNAFECGWLAGDADTPNLAAAAAGLPPQTVIVTSYPGLMRGHIGNLLVGVGDQLLAEHPAVVSTAKGTGDLFAALYLGRMLEGRTPRKALSMAAASTFEMIAAAARLGSEDLPLAQMQTAIVQPHAMINLRQMAPKLSPKPRPL